MTEFNYQLNPVQVDPSGHYDFQNVFDFPDFIEMRPVLREAVRQVAKEGVKEPTLPVQVERMATALEEQLERCTRKYERQAGYYPNQKRRKTNSPASSPTSYRRSRRAMKLTKTLRTWSTPSTKPVYQLLACRSWKERDPFIHLTKTKNSCRGPFIT